MRLFEIADRFIDDLTTVLKTIQGRAIKQRMPQSLTYPALSNLLKNLNYGEITFEQFQQIYDQNPVIQSLVSNFNERMIVLNTEEQKPDEFDAGETGIGAKTVDQMAHNVVSKEY